MLFRKPVTSWPVLKKPEVSPGPEGSEGVLRPVLKKPEMPVPPGPVPVFPKPEFPFCGREAKVEEARVQVDGVEEARVDVPRVEEARVDVPRVEETRVELRPS